MSVSLIAGQVLTEEVLEVFKLHSSHLMDRVTLQQAEFPVLWERLLMGHQERSTTVSRGFLEEE